MNPAPLQCGICDARQFVESSHYILLLPLAMAAVQFNHSPFVLVARQNVISKLAWPHFAVLWVGGAVLWRFCRYANKR